MLSDVLYNSYNIIVLVFTYEELNMNVLMDIIELIEKRKFKYIDKNVKLKKYNNLYKGKNKYVLKIWKRLINENNYFDKYKEFSFVNFRYVCEFLLNIKTKIIQTLIRL
ncbi:hypothetical protein C923_04016 [Plasmodium falciparum UGT5.1]|uniref:Uncharacterized protein n=1 Tax=Plasmodium falciparum UGT5.1 TaxID=1237627 RepID=W7JUX2_PLAFA|nr:hypothetical protein C923_04016 [Plasmodium falciparum UGT5.1]